MEAVRTIWNLKEIQAERENARRDAFDRENSVLLPALREATKKNLKKRYDSATGLSNREKKLMEREKRVKRLEQKYSDMRTLLVGCSVASAGAMAFVLMALFGV